MNLLQNIFKFDGHLQQIVPSDQRIEGENFSEWMQHDFNRNVTIH